MSQQQRLDRMESVMLHYDDGNDDYSIVVDLLADIREHCDNSGISFESALDLSRVVNHINEGELDDCDDEFDECDGW